MHWKNLRRTRSLSTTEMTATGLSASGAVGGGHSTSTTTSAAIAGSSTSLNALPSNSNGVVVNHHLHHHHLLHQSGAATTACTVSDGSVLLSLTKWSDEDSHSLQDFVKKYPLPQMARFVKGHYLTLGVPSLPINSSPYQTVFLCSIGKRLKIAAQCVKFKEGSKKVVPMGPKLAVPENYQGWFEILSEEGRAVRCIESVAELARRFPDSCLVRDNIKAYVARGDDIETITDKVRTIAAGETLVLISEVLGTSANPKASEKGGRTPGRFLRCFDIKGENVYLNFDQRGKFSIIAKEDNISGVHSIKNLLTKRFPLMVRLVSGKSPVWGGNGKVGSNFVPEMRLYASFEEDCVMALPLQSREPPSIVAVPLTATLKLQAAKNSEVLRKSQEHSRLEEACKVLIEELADKIQMFDIALSRELRASVEAQLSLTPAHANPRRMPYFRRAISEPYGYRMSTGLDSASAEAEMPDKNDTRYDEIDQIYDYVRGFAPLPKSTAPDSILDDVGGGGATVDSSAVVNGAAKPDPPPIETIPARRVLANPDLIQFHHHNHHNHHHQMASSVDTPTPPSTTPMAVVASSVPPIGKMDSSITAENIYERIPRKGGEVVVSPEMRMLGLVQSSKKSSGPRAYYVHSRSSKNKIYIKSAAALNRNNNNNYNNKNMNNNNGSSAGMGHLKTSRFFRYHHHGKQHPQLPPPCTNVVTPATKEVPKTVRSVKSLTTSPIFNIRYKSLTNLALDFNTLDSSNSGGQISASSGGGERGGGGGGGSDSYIIESDNNNRHRGKRLMMARPKSLTNLVCEINNHLQDYNRANILNSAICRLDPRRHSNESSQSTSKESDKEKLSSPSIARTKRLGTLYL